MAYKEFKEFYYKVVLRGPTFTQSGYGEYCRSLYRILNQFDEFDITLQATPWGMTPFIMDHSHPDWNMLMKGVERTTIEVQQQIKYDISFQVQLPDEWDPTVADFNIGVTAATEVDRVSEQWQVACNNMDLVIAMSEHTKRTLLNGPIEVTTPIIVLGSALSEDIIDESYECPLVFPDYVQDVLLHVGQVHGDPERDRKNTFGLIKSFKETFKDDPSKALVLKVNLGRNTAIDRNNTIVLLKNYIAQACPGSKANVYLLHGPMTTKQIGSLYRHPKVRAFVSFTRGEGFGLPFLEAAANGLPIVATDHSSYTEFLKVNGESKFVRADFVMKEVPQRFIEGRVIPQGSRWAEVPPQESSSVLAKLFKKGFSVPLEWAKDLKPIVREKYNIHNLVNYLADELCEKAPEVFAPDQED